MRLLVCYHCLGAAYTVAVYLHTPLCHFLCLSTRASVLRLLSCHSAALKPFLLAGTNYKSINSLSQSLHEVSTDSALCNPDWQLIFKGCTSLIVVSPGLRYLVNPVALLWQFEKKKMCSFPSFSICTNVPLLCLPLLADGVLIPKSSLSHQM